MILTQGFQNGSTTVREMLSHIGSDPIQTSLSPHSSPIWPETSRPARALPAMGWGGRHGSSPLGGFLSLLLHTLQGAQEPCCSLGWHLGVLGLVLQSFQQPGKRGRLGALSSPRFYPLHIG